MLYAHCLITAIRAPHISVVQYKPMHNGPTLLGVNGTKEDYEEWKFGYSP
jgi:hypothetical protein